MEQFTQAPGRIGVEFIPIICQGISVLRPCFSFLAIHRQPPKSFRLASRPFPFAFPIVRKHISI
jgi:hypothetical protein